MSLAVALLLAAQAAAQAAPPPPRAPAATASASASVTIVEPAVIDFDAPMDESVRADHARAQISRDEAGTVWAQFQ